MIRINKDYFIDIDSLNYTVKRDYNRKVKSIDKKTGKEVEKDSYGTVGHYNGLTSAIKGVIDDMNRRKLRDEVHTLEEAISIVIENNNQFKELLEKALEI